MSIRTVAAGLVALFVALALIVGPARPLLSSAAHALGLRASQAPAMPGKPMPALGLTSLDGSPVTLDNRGTVVYNVFTSWCPSCNEELPDILRTQARLRKAGVRFVGIDQGEPADRVAAFVAERGIRYPVVLDSSRSTTTLLGARMIPETVIVQNGTVRQIIVGPTTQEQLTQAIKNV